VDDVKDVSLLEGSRYRVLLGARVRVQIVLLPECETSHQVALVDYIAAGFHFAQPRFAVLSFDVWCLCSFVIVACAFICTFSSFFSQHHFISRL
jgi:hypothetical protein